MYGWRSREKDGALMTERNAHKSKFNGNLFLLVAGWFAVALPGFGQRGTAESEAAKISAPVYGQLLHTDGLLPSFETATLRPSKNLPVSYWGWGPYGYVIKTP